MLFAQTDWWVGPAWSGIGGGVVYLTGWVYKLWRERVAQRKSARTDAIDEWIKLHNLDQSELKDARAQNEHKGEMILSLTAKYAAAETEIRALNDRIRQMDEAVFQMQKGCSLKDGCPALRWITRGTPVPPTKPVEEPRGGA